MAPPDATRMDRRTTSFDKGSQRPNMHHRPLPLHVRAQTAHRYKLSESVSFPRDCE